MTASEKQLVFATVPYTNAAPLVHCLGEVSKNIKLISAPPSELTAKLISQDADVALIPVVDFLCNDQLRMIGNLGICADGPVKSVLLKCFRPINELGTLKVDPASRTSNALADILLTRYFRLSLDRVEDIGLDSDAAVMIGDRALCSRAAPCGDYDLAGLWKETTGLPFVFAVWACRQDSDNIVKISSITKEALERGRKKIDELAKLHARRLGLSYRVCRRYLSEVIRYDVGDKEREGMMLFGAFLSERGYHPGISANDVRLSQ